MASSGREGWGEGGGARDRLVVESRVVCVCARGGAGGTSPVAGGSGWEAASRSSSAGEGSLPALACTLPTVMFRSFSMTAWGGGQAAVGGGGAVARGGGEGRAAAGGRGGLLGWKKVLLCEEPLSPVRRDGHQVESDLARRVLLDPRLGEALPAAVQPSEGDEESCSILASREGRGWEECVSTASCPAWTAGVTNSGLKP